MKYNKDDIQILIIINTLLLMAYMKKPNMPTFSLFIKNWLMSTT
jgi:hypothetical protein